MMGTLEKLNGKMHIIPLPRKENVVRRPRATAQGGLLVGRPELNRRNGEETVGGEGSRKWENLNIIHKGGVDW